MLKFVRIAAVAALALSCSFGVAHALDQGYTSSDGTCADLSAPYDVNGIANNRPSTFVVDKNGRPCVNVVSTTQYPINSTPITASATGTTAATTATLAGVASKTTYICGLSIRANATAAATGNATVTGTITGTLNFTQWTAPLASGIGVVEQRFAPCIPASAVNTGIAIISAAPGSGGVVSVTGWGYQL